MTNSVGSAAELLLEIRELKLKLYGSRVMSPCCDAPMCKYPSLRLWQCNDCKGYHELIYKTNGVGAAI